MFQKFNPSKFIEENLKSHTFEEVLDLLYKKAKNSFLRFIKESYSDFKDNYDELLTKLNSSDLEYVSLYIRGRLNKCPVCGKYFEGKHNKCCSKECSMKFNYGLERFTGILDKTNNFEESLRELHREEGPNKFSADINSIYPYFKQQFDELLKKIGSDDLRFINLYIQDKLSKCKVCGKVIVKPRIFCCAKCYGQGFDYNEINKNKDYTKIGQSISDTLLNRTEKEKKEHLEKIRKTKLERYGKEDFTNPEKAKKTCLERYGYSSYCKTSEFKERLAKSAISKYKHAENFNKEYIEANFIEDGFLKIHECSEYFGVHVSVIYKRIKNLGIEFKFRTGSSDAENSLFSWIPVENKIHNSRGIIPPKELDIFIPDYNLAIEYNGNYWHSFYEPNYHKEKTMLCLEKGIKLFQIFETDNLEIWKSMILNSLGKSTKIYARNCEIRQVSSKEASLFLDENHIQGKCGSNIRLGLFYNDNLVQIMTFGKPRFNKKYDFELLRLCSLRGHCVVGGASKLFKFFRENFKGSVITYCNLRYSYGNIYKTLGFTQLSINEPSYFYSKNFEVLSRYQCQKHKLKNFLENFDENLTESENMINNGYLKVFDSGSITFVMDAGTNDFSSVITTNNG